jgi:putative SOS response-associated peptidase YedK
MCNEYEFLTQWEEYEALMASLALPLPAAQTSADLPQLPRVRISDSAPVLRVAGNGVELVPMRFGFPPPRPKASPVFNFRSEGRRFVDSKRCLVPATAFFEFTGKTSPKTRHRFWLRDQPLFAIAGIWRETPAGEAFTLLTVEPGPDVASIHNRQVVVLAPPDWAAWLYLLRPEAELLRPSSPGTLASAIV